MTLSPPSQLLTQLQQVVQSSILAQKLPNELGFGPFLKELHVLEQHITKMVRHEYLDGRLDAESMYSSRKVPLQEVLDSTLAILLDSMKSQFLSTAGRSELDSAEKAISKEFSAVDFSKQQELLSATIMTDLREASADKSLNHFEVYLEETLAIRFFQLLSQLASEIVEKKSLPRSLILEAIWTYSKPDIDRVQSRVSEGLLLQNMPWLQDNQNIRQPSLTEIKSLQEKLKSFPKASFFQFSRGKEEQEMKDTLKFKKVKRARATNLDWALRLQHKTKMLCADSERFNGLLQGEGKECLRMLLLLLVGTNYTKLAWKKRARIYVEEVVRLFISLDVGDPLVEVQKAKGGQREVLMTSIKKGLLDRTSELVDKDPTYELEDPEELIFVAVAHVLSVASNFSPKWIVANRAYNRELVHNLLSFLLGNRLKELIYLQELDRLVQARLEASFTSANLPPLPLNDLSFDPWSFPESMIDLKYLAVQILSKEEQFMQANAEHNCRFPNTGQSMSTDDYFFEHTLHAKGRIEFDTTQLKALAILKQEMSHKQQLLKLQRLGGARSSESNHVIIIFSGFLSGNDIKEEHWAGLLEHFNPEISRKSTQLFALHWDASNYQDLFWHLGDTFLGKEGVRGIVNMTKMVGIDRYANQYNTRMEYGDIDPFIISKKNANRAGRLLGALLALRIPFRTQSVSLIGFSLGCQIIKSCLKTLDQVYGSEPFPYLECDLIQNVTMIGGAANFKNKEKWKGILEQVVNGKIRSVFSKGDLILKNVYPISQKGGALGKEETLLKHKTEDGEEVDQLENIDVTFNVLNSDSQNSMEKIFDFQGFGHTSYFKSKDFLKTIFLNIDSS